MLRAVHSLRFRLVLGAGMIGLVAVLASGLTIQGMSRMSQQVKSAVTAEQRIQRYAVLASQVGSLIVVLYEASQNNLDADTQTARFEGLRVAIGHSFAQIRSDLDRDIGTARRDDLDEQSRRATRSIGIARMEALLKVTLDRFQGIDQTADPDLRAVRMQGQINAFSLGFDPLLNGAITQERRIRDAAIAEVEVLRNRLTQAALGVGVLAVLMVSGFYLAVVRPQFSRLDRLKTASEAIGQGNFRVDLPGGRTDEIGQLFLTTQQMAESLSRRKSEVDDEWSRLNQTIFERTEALRSANEALAKTDEDRRRFFADVSHELRTPLTVILMEADLALKSGAETHEAFRVIRNRARRLNQRIDDLLRIARSESGTLSMEARVFDLGEATGAAVADMRRVVESAGLELSLQEAAPQPVLGDLNWARQVVTGLIENALRHARDGGVIRVQLAQEGEMALVQVIDNGPGIEAADLDRVMARFAQARDSSKSAGFGIGLSLARWIIEEQGGHITLQSPVPEPLRAGLSPGTLVTVFLPRAEG